jgi:hypothetical protein
MGVKEILPHRFFKTFTMAAGLAASSITNVGLTEGEVEQYAPFNLVNIVNRSNQHLAIIPDGIPAKKMIVGDGSDKTFSDVHFKEIEMENLDAVNVTSQDIFITVQREISIRDLIHYIGEAVAIAIAENREVV